MVSPGESACLSLCNPAKDRPPLSCYTRREAWGDSTPPTVLAISLPVGTSRAIEMPEFPYSVGRAGRHHTHTVPTLPPSSGLPCPIESRPALLSRPIRAGVASISAYHTPSYSYVPSSRGRRPSLLAHRYLAWLRCPPFPF